MANCAIDNKEVETHRYIRAEPLYLEGGKLHPVQGGSSFFCLSHPIEEIEEAIAKSNPPTEELPTRILWSPAPYAEVGPGTPEGQAVVKEKVSRDGFHGLRSIIVTDRANLHLLIRELIPDGSKWYIPHANAPTIEQAEQIIMEKLMSSDPEFAAQLAEKIKRL